MRNGHDTMLEALLLADRCLQPDARATALAARHDPLRIDLPPFGAGEGGAPSVAGLRGMSALYLQAELEQAGIVSVAELLAREWDTLSVTSDEAAELLEEFSRRSRDWYDRDGRDRIFARLFGLGRLAGEGSGATSNRGFENRLASVCLALVRHGDGWRFGERPSAAREAGLRHAGRALLADLAPRESGNTLHAGRRIQQQLQLAIELLRHPAVGALFGARGLWDTLRRVMGADAPDFARILDRGQSGQRILLWLADVLPHVVDPADTRSLLEADSPLYRFAASWLEASGLELAPAALQRVA
jgi:hypothetical protein